MIKLPTDGPWPRLTKDQVLQLAQERPADFLRYISWHPATEIPPRTVSGAPLSGPELREWVRERSPVVLLGLSFGKDSLASFHALREHWAKDEIIGYFLWSHPHLGFQQRSLGYYRRELGIRIYSIAHRSLSMHLVNGTDQPPSHLPVIWAHKIRELSYPDLYWSIAADADVLHLRPWVAHGIRAADSPRRRVACLVQGPYNLRERAFYPIWDEVRTDLVRRLTELNVKLPVDYRLFGRTFDGQDYRFTKPLHDHFPEDYERLRDMFPLLEADWVRRGVKLP